MRALSLGLGVLGLSFALSGCVYYPDGLAAYGPDWCSYHPRRCAAMYGPYGPPPPGYAGPPPGYAGPPPGYAPPPPGSAPQAQSAPQGPAPSQAQLAKVNDPTWCNSHPRKCEQLRERFGMVPPENGAARLRPTAGQWGADASEQQQWPAGFTAASVTAGPPRS